MLSQLATVFTAFINVIVTNTSTTAVITTASKLTRYIIRYVFVESLSAYTRF